MRFLHGGGIDIGASDDPLQVQEGWVRVWDMQDGDATRLDGIEDGAFDFVYSSHCLEHLRDVEYALVNWIRVLKPSGIL